MLESLNTKEFKYTRLSADEMQQRGILGRLVGPIADTVNPTRNGRYYSEDLWEKVFDDPIMQEKINDRLCLGELGHPLDDRSEIDIEKAAICLAEMPKKGKDGLLYGVFDILSTPNGKILKSLCDYGCRIGVSSRGQGDLIEDYDGKSEVDPNTYDCVCWDAVLIPAVKKAKQTLVTESLNRTLKQKLTEDLNRASDEDKKIMKETLNNLDIKLEEDAAVEDKVCEEPVQEEVVDKIEEAKDESLKEVIKPEEGTDREIIIEYKDKELMDAVLADEEAHDSLIDELDDYSKGEATKMKFVITYDDDINEWSIGDIEVLEEECKNECIDETTPLVKNEECNNPKDCANIDDSKEAKEVVKEETEAEDNGNDLIEQLQEALKENAQLKQSVIDLQNKLAVSDTKTNKVKEDLDKYVEATITLSEGAKKAKKLAKRVSSLTEELESTKANMKKTNLNESVTNKVLATNKQLKEDLKKSNESAKALKEQLDELKANSEIKRSEYNSNIIKAKKLIEESKELANNTVNRYIESKAVMLGITPNEIKNRLDESYTIDDIDGICEELQSYAVNISKLPFDVKRSRMRVTESKKEPLRIPSMYDDDIDSDLLEMARMK